MAMGKSGRLHDPDPVRRSGDYSARPEKSGRQSGYERDEDTTIYEGRTRKFRPESEKKSSRRKLVQMYEAFEADYLEYYGQDEDPEEARMEKRRGRQKKQRPKGFWKNRLVNGGLKVLSVLAAVAIIAGLGLNLPIVSYRTENNGTMEIEKISYLDSFKRAQPAILQEGELEKPDPEDTSALNLRADINPETTNDGLNLEQIVEGQYTVLFVGMDESGQLADVNWLFQFDLFAGTMNVLQIPRDSYVPQYANYSTGKFNSVYGSGQEQGVTPLQRVVNCIEESFCVIIDCYIKLDCEDIKHIVDAVGGIPITLPEEIMYEADKVLPAGEQVLTGQQSEWFIRFRREYDEGDIGRVKAQRIFLAAAMEKLLSMGQTGLMSAMEEIYDNEWLATDLSLAEMSMLADFAANRLTLEGVNIFMVPGEGAIAGDQSVYSIHKNETIDLINEYFRPYQNQVYPEESTIVELIPEGQYQSDEYNGNQENLSDISDGETEDGRQNIYSENSSW
ncbi:MAG: LCP family protein [Ruminococcus sp.]|nr:LCP family protein [Ruminococcus sp.]